MCAATRRIAGLGVGQSGVLRREWSREVLRLPLCIRSRAEPARSQQCAMHVGVILSEVKRCHTRLSLDQPILALPGLGWPPSCRLQVAIEAPRAPRLPHPLGQWGWGPWHARASTPSAEWTLARSLAGCAGQERPSLAGKMLTLYRPLEALSSAGCGAQLLGPRLAAG